LSNNNTPFGVRVDSDAGDQTPLLQAAIAKGVAINFCNCLFTTLVTRVGHLLLQYSAPIEASSAPRSRSLGLRGLPPARGLDSPSLIDLQNLFRLG